MYITKTGCQWRMLPNDFPPYSTVWSFYRRANQSGLWDRILLALVQKTFNPSKTSNANLCHY
ncbi:transposase [Kingella kingae]|uniref:transposase n=1 Tax=Kingella kingae TaxID=504 RepID=UPI0013DE91D3|nr:transposase [Kingella kingae]